ncbi:MAG TPA: hypothetical protein PKI61_03715 [bacterium]|nr:hypothetical protein [bacterium]HPT29815.1 hypothetical protein [bacterium]
MENIISEQLNNHELLNDLVNLLDKNKDKRVVVVGTTCTGKTTFLKDLPDAADMDELVFPQLTQEEHDYVCQHPWTPAIGETMARLVREKVKVENGRPVFGTVVLDSDLIVYLHISDELLRQRTELRGANFIDAKNMQQQIEEDIRMSNIPMIQLSVG